MELFFDTETTGIPRNYNAPVSDIDNWPRLVQLGFIVMNGQTVILEYEEIVKPDGFEIPIGASKVHGVSTERAMAEGNPIYEVLSNFEFWLESSDVVVGHSIDRKSVV